jgi:pimeloyl-ACP methyl ester carboxylesterase
MAEYINSVRYALGLISKPRHIFSFLKGILFPLRSQNLLLLFLPSPSQLITYRLSLENMLPRSKPIVVIAHGAWHSPVHYARLVAALEAASFPTICPVQPTYNAKPPTKTVHDDAIALREVLSGLVEQDELDVILVMHSYGGPVGTQALTEKLSRNFRAEKGLKGGVIKLLYMTSFMLKEGQSLGSIFGGALPPFIPTEVC